MTHLILERSLSYGRADATGAAAGGGVASESPARHQVIKSQDKIMNHEDGMRWNADEYLSWRPAGSSEAPSSSRDDSDGGTAFVAASLVPRPTAWISAYPASDASGLRADEPLVALVEGYCGASDRPPTLMLGSDGIPPLILNGLREHGTCALSVATEREGQEARRASASVGERCGPARTFEAAGLRPCRAPAVLSSLPAPKKRPAGRTGGTNEHGRPPAVESSPVQMHCRLALEVPLLSKTRTQMQTDSNGGEEDTVSSMLLLQVDTYVIKGCTLRKQTTLYPGRTTLQGNPDVRSITAKIDCLLLRPLASLGNGRFGRVERIYHMGRPRPRARRRAAFSKSQVLINGCNPNDKTRSGAGVELNESTCDNVDWESGAMWEIDDLVAADEIHDGARDVEGDGETITYTYRVDPCCPLGYNPMKQVVCPRFIGWISTYEPGSLHNGDGGVDMADAAIPHISPYSFFMNVAHGSRPIVAFAACPRSDEFANSDDDSSGGVDGDKIGARWKDAQRDAERTGVFCVNLVPEGLAWAMNASAAPLGKGLSEFGLMERGDSSSSDGSDCQCSQRQIPTPSPAPGILAPFVPQSPLFMECRYVKTVKIPEIFEGDSMYSLIMGEVVNVHIRQNYLESKESNREALIDLQKVRPVARLGYGQEYTIISNYLDA
ncbi:hypothetical protein ACHAWF_007461 [Thalassiosira exigua]